MLSENDLALVNALQINPRAPWSLVGATLGIGAATAARRWQRLADERAVWMTAYPSGDLVARLVLAFVEVDCVAGRALELARLIAADPHVSTVDYLAGRCDLLLHLAAPSLSAVTDHVEHRLAAMPGVLRCRTLVSPRIYSEGSKWRLRAISPGQTEALATASPHPGPAPAFGDQDRALMLALGRDGRASYADLAAAAGVSASTARRHVDTFLANGSVRVRCEIARAESPSPVGVVLWLRVPANQVVATARLLARLREVRLSAAITGAANLIVVLWVRSTADVPALESGLVDRRPWLEIVDRAVVLRPVKLMGRLLDAAGRCDAQVPLDFWSPVEPAAAGRRP